MKTHIELYLAASEAAAKSVVVKDGLPLSRAKVEAAEAAGIDPLDEPEFDKYFDECRHRFITLNRVPTESEKARQAKEKA